MSGTTSIRELSFNDAERFLSECNIKEKAIREHIINTSKGLPFYLDLQVDTYNRITEKNIDLSVSNFGRNYIDILERFTKYLAPSEIETLKILACSSIWDYQIFKKVIREFQTGYPLLSFRELCSFSFVTEIPNQKSDASYSIHQIMQSHLVGAIDQNSRHDIHTFFFMHFEELLNAQSQDHIELNPDILYILEQAIAHKREIVAATDFYEWLLGVSRRLYGNATSNLIQEALRKSFEVLVFSDSYSLLTEICLEIARLYSWSNVKIDEENQFIENGLGFIAQIVSDLYGGQEDVMIKKEPDIIRIQADLLIMKAEILRRLDKNMESYEIYLKAIETAKKVNYPPNLLSYSRLLTDLGKFPEAEGFFYTSLHQSVNDKDLDGQALFCHEIGTLFMLQKEYNLARMYYQYAIDLYTKFRGSDHKYCWIVRRRYGNCLIYLGQLNEANELLVSVRKWYQSTYGETYYEIGYTSLYLANCEFSLGNAVRAIEYLSETISLIYPKFGASNAEIMEAQLLFCKIVQQINTDPTGGIAKGLKQEYLDSITATYNLLIKQFAAVSDESLDAVIKNIGYGSTVLESYFGVVSRFFELTEQTGAKLDGLRLKKKESNRVVREQFNIRYFKRIKREQLTEEEKESFTNRLQEELGILKNSQVKLFKSKLKFFADTYVYILVYSDNTEKYLFESESKLLHIDCTNHPFYTVAEKQFLFSLESAEEYVHCFYDAVKGKHGKFYIPFDDSDIPCRVDVEFEESRKTALMSEVKTMKVLEVAAERIVFEAYMYFQDSLFRSKIEVSPIGRISIYDDELVLENLPIAFEPLLTKVIVPQKALIGNIIRFLNGRFRSLEISEVDREIYDALMNNIAFVEVNFEVIQSMDRYITKILDDGLFIISKYIRPSYDNDFTFRKDVGEMMDVMKNLLTNSDFFIDREAIQLYIRPSELSDVALSELELGQIQSKIKAEAISPLSFTKAYKRRLSFLPNSMLYKLSTQEGKFKYALSNGEHLYFLDTTNRFIYTVTDENFVLSDKTVKEYLYFFFDAVHGMHGRFHIASSNQDIPFRKDTEIDEEVSREILSKTKEPEVLSITEEEIVLSATIFFQNALFYSKVKVNSHGICDIFDEELIMEDIPVDV
ncbi:tetratricopeptide repeat protein [Dyadobacter sp. CY347]|uniref:tetratricopeptide repeat protein n=1 Tax=Dyadobacter sp. CY347 TaxID=2909336 RepID=UPI001F37D1BA|nr:tetratricopeptide repeat protein [Dyadobacter sp. CY347]MCF2490793.1 tetratricopeptide repeat protein [Dyadobacter sp. CY347]